MKRAALIAWIAVMVVYVFVWLGFAAIMVLTGQGPKNWIGWMVIIANPFLFAFLIGLVQRARLRRQANG